MYITEILIALVWKIILCVMERKFKRNSAGNKFENPDVCILPVTDHFCYYYPEKLSNEQKYNLVFKTVPHFYL